MNVFCLRRLGQALRELLRDDDGRVRRRVGADGDGALDLAGGDLRARCRWPPCRLVPHACIMVMPGVEASRRVPSTASRVEIEVLRVRDDGAADDLVDVLALQVVAVDQRVERAGHHVEVRQVGIEASPSGRRECALRRSPRTRLQETLHLVLPLGLRVLLCGGGSRRCGAASAPPCSAAGRRGTAQNRCRRSRRHRRGRRSRRRARRALFCASAISGSTSSRPSRSISALSKVRLAPSPACRPSTRRSLRPSSCRACRRRPGASSLRAFRANTRGSGRRARRHRGRRCRRARSGPSACRRCAPPRRCAPCPRPAPGAAMAPNM